MKAGVAARGLIIVRGGDQSLHQAWLQGDVGRDWDLHISYYGKAGAPRTYGHGDVTWSVDDAPAKYPGLAQCLAKSPFDLDRYDYIAMPDDDVIVDLRSWNRAFELCRQYSLAAAQLANHRDSFFTQDITLERPWLRLRHVSRIELQLPILRRDVFDAVSRWFSHDGNLWAMDHVVAREVERVGGRMAILDETVGLHTRIHGVSSVYDIARNGGPSFEDTMLAFLRKHELPFVGASVLGAVDRGGREVGVDFSITRRRLLPKAQQIWRRFRGVREIASSEDGRIHLVRAFNGVPTFTD